jgi:hypothetical protein
MADNQTPQLPNEVHVVDSDGNVQLMDVTTARQAIQAGAYRPATAAELQELSDQKTYGEGLANPLKAGAESALGTATFGLSRELENASGLTTPEAQAKRAKYNPVASDIVGPAVGIIGPLMAPEVEGAGLFGEAANPVKAVSKAGQAVSEAAAPVAEGAAKLIANPETSPIVNKIVSKAIATGAGSAVEGAAYGLGQAVNEDAMGNPEALGDKLMSHIGYNSLMFGGLGAGLGGVVGAYSGATEKYLPKFLAPTEKAALEAGDFKASVNASEMSQAEKEGVLSGLGKQKENASEIKAAAEKIGAPVLESQTSASDLVQKADSALLNGPPTMASMRRQAMLRDGYQAAERAVGDAVGQESALSAAEAGDLLKKSVADKIEQEYAPLKELYKEVEPYQEAIPLTDRSTGALSRNINKIIEEQRLIEGTSRYNYVKQVADSIDQVKDLAWLKNFRTEVSKSAPMEAKDLARAINDKLNGVEERAIRRFAETMKTSQAKEKIMGLLDQMDAAKEGYKAFAGKMEELGKALGKKNFKGAQNFLDHIDEMTPEKFLKKAFAKDNSEFLKFFQKNFPEETEFLMRYQRGEIIKNAMKDGQLMPSKVFKQVNDMSPELKRIMFKPEELDKLHAAETWINSLPKNINPSGTAHASAFRAFFESPTGAIIANARDFGLEKFVKATGRLDPEGAAKVAGLAQIERTAQKQTQTIVSGAKAIFKASGKAALPASAFLGIAAGKHDDQKDLINKIDKLNSDPSHFIDHLDERTRSLYTIAPKTAGAIQQTAIRATQFLSSKAPKEQQAGPMSRKLPPSQADLSKFNLYYQTVENPTDVLKHVAAGTLTPEHMETLQTVYPTLFSEMKSTVMESLMDHMAKPSFEMPYKKRQSLSLFLGQDLDGSLNTQNVQTNQMAMQTMGVQQAKADAQTQGKVTQGGLKGLNAGSRMLTAMQSNSQRENA